MAGLVPATYALLAAWLKQDVGARHKAGHDDREIVRQPDQNQLQYIPGNGFARRQRNAMIHTRRKFLRLAAGAAALPPLSRFAWAQAYPTRPVHIVAGVPPGLAPDILARLTGQFLSERLGQQFVIDNRPGAGTNIATEAVVRAAPDGYTLLLVTPANATNAALYPSLNFNFIRDTAPVAGICLGPFVMAAGPSLPAKTVPEFIAHAKANPGRINMASAGNGTPPHVFGELFKVMAGVDFVHVPYRSSYVPDLLGGQVQFAFMSIPASIDFIRAGKLRALAVTPAKRVDALPDVPAMAEFLPGYDAGSWTGIVAPRNTPAEIVEKLNKEISAVIADPAFAARLAALGNVPMPMTPADFGKFVADETEKWAKVVKFAGIKPE
jgi:tripartite-type tricarboxylate transporter receptor subunit TctC